MMGIEPISFDWKSNMLPLTPHSQVPHTSRTIFFASVVLPLFMRLLGIEPKLSDWRPEIIPLDHNRLRIEPPEGVEPTTYSLQNCRSAWLSYGGRNKKILLFCGRHISLIPTTDYSYKITFRLNMPLLSWLVSRHEITIQ